MDRKKLLDNLPTHARTDFAAEGGGSEDLTGASHALAPAIGDDVVPGSRIAWQEAAARWLRDALDVAPRVVAFDYMTTTADMARRPWTDWLRTYRGHDRGRDPLVDLGAQDITCEVAIDQLAAVRAPVSVRDQRAFLTEHGIDELVEDGRAAWERGAAEGGLEAIHGRSRVREAEALTISAARWVHVAEVR